MTSRECRLGGIRGRPLRVVLSPQHPSLLSAGPTVWLCSLGHELQEPPGKCGCGEQAHIAGGTVVRGGAVALTAPVRTGPAPPLKCVKKHSRDVAGGGGVKTARILCPKAQRHRGMGHVVGMAMGQDPLKKPEQCFSLQGVVHLHRLLLFLHPSCHVDFHSLTRPSLSICMPPPAGGVGTSPGAMQITR